MAFELASLFVSIKGDDSPLQKQVNGVRSQLTGMGVAIGTAAGNLLSSAVSGASSAIGGFFKSGIGGAIQLQDTMSATSAVLGDSAGAVFSWADQMATQFGAVKNESIGAALSFAQVFKSVGKSADEAAALGTQIAKLGMDLASFKGGSNQDAFIALQAAMRGEFDPLERYNIQLSAAAVSQEAMRMGLAKSATEVDNNAKKMATLSLIMRGSVDMQGDLERTADQAGNQWRLFSGTLTNLAADMGTVLMPAITAVLQAGSGMAQGLAAFFSENKASFAEFGATVVSWVETIGVGWRNLPDLWEIVQIKFREMFTNMVAALATLPENLAIIGEWFANNWVNLIRDGVNAVLAIFTNLGENIYRLGQAIADWLANPTGGFHVDFKPLLDGFQATTGQLPEMVKPAFVSLQSEIDAVTNRMADREGDRAKRIADEAAAKTLPAKKAAEKVEDVEKFKAATLASDDYFSKLREQNIAAADELPKKQLETQQKIASNTERMADQFARAALGAMLG